MNDVVVNSCKRLRVLVVDDAVVIRRIVTDVLGGDPGIEVVGAAANGKIALAKVEQVNPDLLTMDVEMPEMDGLQTLRALRKTHPRLPVIMFSTLTARGAAATLDALAAGASDYVTKPANVGSVAAAMARIREELIPKIKALCGKTKPAAVTSDPRRAIVPPAVRAPIPASRTPGANQRIEAIVIGCSTGGPNALAEVIPQLPADLPVPVLIVQHMPPLFTRLLAERLAAQSPIRVREATEGEVIRPGEALVAPGDHHMTIARDGIGSALCVRMNQAPPENSCRPAVDVLFRTAAATYGPACLGVVLTGMGQDGLRGSRDICDAGGRVIAQDEASSVVWGMPGYVAKAGLAQRVLPLAQIGEEMVRLVAQSRGAAGGEGVQRRAG